MERHDLPYQLARHLFYCEILNLWLGNVCCYSGFPGDNGTMLSELTDQPHSCSTDAASPPHHDFCGVWATNCYASIRNFCGKVIESSWQNLDIWRALLLISEYTIRYGMLPPAQLIFTLFFIFEHKVTSNYSATRRVMIYSLHQQTQEEPELWSQGTLLFFQHHILKKKKIIIKVNYNMVLADFSLWPTFATFFRHIGQVLCTVCQ